MCTPCRNGTYASSGRSSECQDCPVNTHSGRGASQCVACDRKSTYASAGSSRCHKRPACTANDYLEVVTTVTPSSSLAATWGTKKWEWWYLLESLTQVHSPCDERNITLVSYEWITPRICRDDVPSAVKLPAVAERRKCPPCSPGMQMDYKAGMCQFCPAGSVSDGIQPCRSCPPSTAANTGLQFLWWNNLPPGISARCMSLEGQSINQSINQSYHNNINK